MTDPIILGDVLEIEEKLGLRLTRFEKIVVLGSNGMLGSYITEALVHLLQKNKILCPVVAVTRSSNDYLRRLSEEHPGTLFLSNYENLDIHCASPASIQAVLSEELGAIDTNIKVMIEVCEILTKKGGHICFLSSGEVYGFNAETPIKENHYSGIDHLNVRGIYPELKRAAETILWLYTKSTDRLTSTSLRVSHTFGPGISLDDPRIFGVVTRAAVNNESIKLRSDGSVRRTFMYSLDLFKAIISTVNMPGFQYFNVAGNSYLSILEYCQIASRLYGNHIEIQVDDSKASVPSNPQDGEIDTTKILSVGWAPHVDMATAFERTVSSIKWRSEVSRNT
jgi:nucleoside-diphosphate-sugar epimerase